MNYFLDKSLPNIIHREIQDLASELEDSDQITLLEIKKLFKDSTPPNWESLIAEQFLEKK